VAEVPEVAGAESAQRTSNAALAALALAAGGAIALAGCEPGVPANPTWVDDVHPILQARCQRCHLTQYTIVRDGATMPEKVQREDLVEPYGKTPRFSFDYATVADIAADPIFNPMPIWKTTMSPFIHAGGEAAGMPPAPATKLDDWQIETIDRWLKEKPEPK